MSACYFSIEIFYWERFSVVVYYNSETELWAISLQVRHIKREKLYRNRSPSQAPDRKHCEFTNFRKHDMIRRSGGRGEERVRKSAEKGKKDRLIAGYVWRCHDRWPKMSSFSTGMSWYRRRVHGNEPQTGFINNVYFLLASSFLQNQL